MLLAHGTVLITLGTSRGGAFFSGAIQFALGVLVVIACLGAGRRSNGFVRYFWQLTALSYCFWLVAQGLSLNNDRSLGFTEWAANLLFCFWFVPLAMTLFLDPDDDHKTFNSLLAIDFVQAILFSIAAYLYFYYLPRSESRTELSHSVWTPYFVGYGLVAGAFLLRARLAQSAMARRLFGQMGIFLILSWSIDAINYYTPVRNLEPGAWIDIAWSILLIIPLFLASAWKSEDLVELAPRRPRPTGGLVVVQLFPLLFPLLVLLMSVRIAQSHIRLAAAVMLVSFVCLSTRQLITNHRMVRAQEALRREATHDGLTGIWNRMAILDILEKELVRSERTGNSVGLIMADIDHFKAVNDTHGHAAGDAVLRIVSSEIASVLRPYDAVGRHGGEEFLIVVPGCNMQETWELAERIRKAVADCQIAVDHTRLKLTLSLGIAAGSFACKSESLLHVADTALYQAKNAGRNRVEPVVDTPTAVPTLPANSEAIFWL